MSWNQGRGPDTQTLVYGGAGLGIVGVTRFLQPGTGTFDVNELAVVVTRGGYLRAFSVRALTGPGAAASDVYTVRINGSDTALAVTLTGAGVQAQTDLDYLAVITGDRVSIKIVTDALTVTANVTASIEVIG